MNILAMSQDPIYIGTGGFTIGRVDNTIVRDPITKIPKIPGTSLAGTWRYYMALTLHSYFKDEYKEKRSERKNKTIEEIFIKEANTWVSQIEGNRYASIKCSGQDESPNVDIISDENVSDTGHCGRCIVCKTFGYSKKNESQKGMAYFSDLNILLFPVYTRFGTRWITSKDILYAADITIDNEPEENKVFISTDHKMINIGWLNLEANKNETLIQNILSQINKYIRDGSNTPESQNNESEKSIFKNLISKEKIIVVPDSLIAQIINSNLETRTSVSIDPMTGAAKAGALFTSEAIPRGTVFYGNVRIEKHPLSNDPEIAHVENALRESKKYFETLGIGGMTTRGFGRLEIFNGGVNSDNQSKS